jgi:hypothetical protein
MPIPTSNFPVAGPATSPSVYPSGGTGNSFQSNGFIPEIWSGKLVEKFYASTVLSAISNTDYEGEIRNQGDRVRIRTKPTITIRDYRADGSLQLERPEGSSITLYIGNGKYFNTILDDVMDIQSDLDALSIWSDDAAQQLKIQVDTDVLGGILNQATARNRGTTAGNITQSVNLGVSSSGPLAVVSRSPSAGQVEILDVILRLGQVLDEQNIPEEGRWVVMPVWAIAQLKFSDLRQAYITGDSTSPMRNGRVGMIDRFTIYSSNLLPAGVAGGLASGEFGIYAGHAHGLTFASQVSKVETLRSELTFGTVLRGLQVYGYQVVDNKAIAQAVVTRA